MPYSTTNQNVTVKELLDAAIQASYTHNMHTFKKIKKAVGTEPITGLGREFVTKVQSNESYGSLTEGGAFPAAGAMVDVRATVNYRSQFSSFDFTGDVEDLKTSRTLQNTVERIMDDTMENFDEKQAFFLFGDGTGTLAIVTAVAGNDVTAATATTTGYGARMIHKGQLLNGYNVGGAAYRVGDMTVNSINRSTDVIAVDAAAAALAANDALVFKGSYNLAPQGFLYHIADSGTWLGLSRTTYPSLNALVHDHNAAIDWDVVELALLKSRNVRGDSAPKYDYMLIGHPVQHKELRRITRGLGNVAYNTKINGTEKADLLVQDVGLAGMSLEEDSNCSPSDIFGIRTSDWNIEEAAPRQLYKHDSGQVFIQKIASATGYADAKEGRVYWRYNYVCKAPHRQFRIKRVTFTASQVQIQRM